MKTEKEIDKRIAEWLGVCWHDYYGWCNICKQSTKIMPSYCQSLDAVAVAETKAIKVFGAEKYIFALIDAFGPHTGKYAEVAIVTAPALTRAAAIARLIGVE